MKSKLILIAFFLAIFTLIESCEKEEGEGGTSTIMGRVFVKNYNDDFSIKLSEGYAPGVDVFIIYGDDSIYSDDFETGIDGWYRFKYLNKGTYTIYSLSDDSTRKSPSGKTVIKQAVEIDDNNSTIVVNDLVIFD